MLLIPCPLKKQTKVSPPALLSLSQQEFMQVHKRKKRTIKLSRWLILIGFLLLWELTSRYGIINSFIFSSPYKIGLCFIDLLKNQDLLKHMKVTLYETIFSFLLLTIISFTFSIVLWIFPFISKVLDPYLVVLNSLPKSALAPFLIVWLGATKTTIIIAGISVAIFGSILNLYTCFLQTDPEKIKLIYTLHGNKLQVLTKVILPGSIPEIISILKVNIGLCLVGVIIGEFLAAKEGLGFLIIYSSQVFKLDWLILSIILLCLMAVVFYAIIGVVERRFQR